MTVRPYCFQFKCPKYGGKPVVIYLAEALYEKGKTLYKYECNRLKCGDMNCYFNKRK